MNTRKTFAFVVFVLLCIVGECTEINFTGWRSGNGL